MKDKFNLYLEKVSEEKNTGKETSRPRATLAVPIRHWIKMGVFKDAKKVLDYGAGKEGANAKMLEKELGITVHAYDPYHNTGKVTDQLSKIDDDYDVVYSTYMFNVIKDQDDFDEALKQIKKRIKPTGNIVVATRDDLIVELAKKYPDKKETELEKIAIEGYVTGKQKFQKKILSLPGLKINISLSKNNSWVTFTKK